jgi:hypothetical protein
MELALSRERICIFEQTYSSRVQTDKLLVGIMYKAPCCDAFNVPEKGQQKCPLLAGKILGGLVGENTERMPTYLPRKESINKSSIR